MHWKNAKSFSSNTFTRLDVISLKISLRGIQPSLFKNSCVQLLNELSDLERKAYKRKYIAFIRIP